MSKSFKKGGLFMPIVIFVAIAVIGYVAFTNREGFQLLSAQLMRAPTQY